VGAEKGLRAENALRRDRFQAHAIFFSEAGAADHQPRKENPAWPPQAGRVKRGSIAYATCSGTSPNIHETQERL
jgi:hypothetical protein